MTFFCSVVVRSKGRPWQAKSTMSYFASVLGESTSAVSSGVPVPALAPP